MRRLAACFFLSLLSGFSPTANSVETAPVVIASTGSGAYPFGTLEVELGLLTESPAECRLSSAPGYPYGALYLDFATEDGLSHYYPVSTYDPGNFSYYAVCRDLQSGTETLDDIRFDIIISENTDSVGGSDNDGNAPVISYVSGSGPHVYGTTPVTLEIATDTDANCRFSWSAGFSFGALYEQFQTSDYRRHTFTVDTWDSVSQTYYARCESISSGLANEEDFPLPVEFLGEDDGGSGGGEQGEEPQITIASETDFESSLASIDLQLSTQIPAACRLSLSGPYDYDVLYTDLITENGLTHSYTLDTYGGGDRTVYASCMSLDYQVINASPLAITITMPEGTEYGGDNGNYGDEILMTNTEYATPYSDRQEPVDIVETDREFIVESGGITFRLSKTSFNLIAEKDGVKLAKNMNSTVRLNGQRLSVEAPVESASGTNWVEFRGWFSKENNLWYIARFRFWPDLPFVHLSFSLTDRHDDHPTEAVWDPLWSQREIRYFNISVGGLPVHDIKTVMQYNAFSGGEHKVDPRIIERTAEGETHWRQVPDAEGNIQLIHWAENSGKTYLHLKPMKTGNYSLMLRQKPLDSPYPAANAVKVIINHVNGRDIVIVDQGLSENPLGNYTLDDQSSVRILAKSHDDSDRIVFGSLELRDSTGDTDSISAHRVTDNVLDTGRIGLVVKDFWKQFPILTKATGRSMIVSSIRNPVALTGGVGFTLDLGLNFNSESFDTNQLSARMIAAPEPSFPTWWSSLDGVITGHQAYTNLMAKTHGIIHTNDEVSGNYGWQNWGDYQIGDSYFTNGDPTENWGALQYDLGHGLLMSWMQTGDDYLWNRAQAAVRSSMDIHIAKFEPYLQKRSGAGLRKGECTSIFHWCQDSIPDFNYHTRSLLLFSHLTGEDWPRDIAHMQIDNSAYFAHTRRQWLIETGSRPLAWALRNLVYGHKVFPQGTLYNESEEYGYDIMSKGTAYADLLRTLTDGLVNAIGDTGHLPGEQPVWQAQILEGLIMAYESGVLGDDLATRTFESIKTSLAYFDNNHIRSLSGNNFEIVYDSDNSEWTNAASYGWFWVNNFAWAGQHINEKYASKAGELIDWLIDTYQSPEYHTTRAWSGVMGFPSYAVSMEN